MKNEKGFTLIEMLIVLMIISVLVLVTIPNVVKHFRTVDDKGCDAYLKMVQSQVQAYKLDYKKYPTVTDLKGEEYLGVEEVVCPDGRAITISSDGKVTAAANRSNGS